MTSHKSTQERKNLSNSFENLLTLHKKLGKRRQKQRNSWQNDCAAVQVKRTLVRSSKSNLLKMKREDEVFKALCTQKSSPTEDNLRFEAAQGGVSRNSNAWFRPSGRGI